METSSPLNRKEKIVPIEKTGLHPRNRNNKRYDFASLVELYPELKQFVFVNTYKRETINFARPEAVRTLNRILLRHFYGISYWDIPEHYLCPPIPGRADYIHHCADLLASVNNNVIPHGRSISVLDTGVGANCIYPLIGITEYGWRFAGSEIDPVAISSAGKIIELNSFPTNSIEIRRQQDMGHIFFGIFRPEDRFDFTICNPPFHSSLDQAEAGTRRKWKNLGISKEKKMPLNFGGQSNELWCVGGEEAFVTKMIKESAEYAHQVFWYSTLVSKQSNLPSIYEELKSVNALEVRTIEMAQGQKKSRFVVWTFLEAEKQKEWRLKRWANL